MSATSVQHLHLASWIMSCSISPTFPVSLSLTLSAASGAKCLENADAAIWHGFSKACFTNFTRKHLTEPKCCQTACCRGPWAQHNDHTSDKCYLHTHMHCRGFFFLQKLHHRLYEDGRGLSDVSHRFQQRALLKPPHSLANNTKSMWSRWSRYRPPTSTTESYQNSPTAQLLQYEGRN